MNTTDKLIDELTEKTVLIYREIETELIYEVARLWKSASKVDGSLEYFISILNNMDVLNRDTLEIISKITGKPLNQLQRDIKQIGYSSLDPDLYQKAYEVGAVSKVPTKRLVETVLATHSARLVRDMNKIQREVARGLYKQTFNAISKAQLEVELGIKSSGQAITEAVDDIAKRGIHTTSYLRQGKEVHVGIEATVRRAVRTSFIETVNNLQEEVAKDMGTDHWYVPQHTGARTTGTGHENHAQWQGKVYTDKEMVTKLGEGNPDMLGFRGYNCRHRKEIYFPGISVPPPPLLDMDELERVYSLEQKQRRMERDIRKTKTIINALELLDSEEANERVIDMKKRLRKQQAKVRKHVKSNEDVLRRDYTRERVPKP